MTSHPTRPSAATGKLEPVQNTALAKLLSPLGWNLLNGLPPYEESHALSLGEAMRKKGIDPELAAAVLTQSRLRAKAHAKFGELAAGMLFTPSKLSRPRRLDSLFRTPRKSARKRAKLLRSEERRVGKQ